MIAWSQPLAGQSLILGDGDITVGDLSRSLQALALNDEALFELAQRDPALAQLLDTPFGRSVFFFGVKVLAVEHGKLAEGLQLEHLRIKVVVPFEGVRWLKLERTLVVDNPQSLTGALIRAGCGVAHTTDRVFVCDDDGPANVCSTLEFQPDRAPTLSALSAAAYAVSTTYPIFRLFRGSNYAFAAAVYRLLEVECGGFDQAGPIIARRGSFKGKKVFSLDDAAWSQQLAALRTKYAQIVASMP